MGASARVEIQRRLRGHRLPCTALRHISPTRNKPLKNSDETDRPRRLITLGDIGHIGNTGGLNQHNCESLR